MTHRIQASHSFTGLRQSSPSSSELYLLDCRIAEPSRQRIPRVDCVARSDGVISRAGAYGGFLGCAKDPYHTGTVGEILRLNLAA